LVLNGSNSYANTLIREGQVRGDSRTIRGNISLVNRGSSVLFDQAVTGTFGGNISGQGSLIKDGSGLLTLSGANSYTAGTFIFLGALQGTSNSLQGNIVNHGELIFNQSFDGTFGGNVSGIGALVKAGAGRLDMTGNAAASVTHIDGGTLAVNGTLQSPNVFVDSGGALAGNDNVVGLIDTRGGGKIEPGNSIGTLHIFGALDMEPQSEYQVQINGASSDEIQVSGTATIQSSTFEIEHYNTASSPVVPGKTYTILTTTGGLTVQAPTLAIADFPFINFALSEDGFNGYLTTSRSAERFADLASTPNEAAVANALDTATSSLAWQQVVGASTADAQAAFSSLSNASIHASAAGVLSEQSHFLRDAVLDRLRQDFPISATPAPVDSVLSYAEDAPAPAVAALPTKKAPAALSLAPVYAVWAQGLGSWGSLSGNSNVARTNDSIGGVISGVDVTYNRMLRLGFAGGYSQSNFNSTNIPASGSSDSYHFAIYGGWQGGPWALRGGGSVSWNDLSTSRQVTAVNLGGAQNGSYVDKTWQGFVEGARNFAFGPAALEPFANVCRRGRERVGSRGDERIDKFRHHLHDAWRARLLRPAGGLDGASDAGLAVCVRRRHADVDPGLPVRRGRLRPGRLADCAQRARHRTRRQLRHRPVRHDWRRLFRPIFRRGERKLRQGESQRAVLRGIGLHGIGYAIWNGRLTWILAVRLLATSVSLEQTHGR
jgi:outer membrane autotransporter protein